MFTCEHVKKFLCFPKLIIGILYYQEEHPGHIHSKFYVKNLGRVSMDSKDCLTASLLRYFNLLSGVTGLREGAKISIF